MLSMNEQTPVIKCPSTVHLAQSNMIMISTYISEALDAYWGLLDSLLLH